ncbi:Uncharacterised protein [Mycobacterium tuberculosis]|nr:Uncharacterised protein [Mycobacterium tuberculosis]
METEKKQLRYFERRLKATWQEYFQRKAQLEVGGHDIKKLKHVYYDQAIKLTFKIIFLKESIKEEDVK